MKINKNDNRFKTGFKQSITGLAKKPILTSILLMGVLLLVVKIHYQSRLFACSNSR